MSAIDSLNVTSAPDASDIVDDIQLLNDSLIEAEAMWATQINLVHPEYRASARNLVHYWAVRQHDLRGLQQRLARLGLSSLGRSEPHVRATLAAIANAAAAVTGRPVTTGNPPVGFDDARRVAIGAAGRTQLEYLWAVGQRAGAQLRSGQVHHDLAFAGFSSKPRSTAASWRQPTTLPTSPGTVLCRPDGQTTTVAPLPPTPQFLFLRRGDILTLTPNTP